MHRALGRGLGQTERTATIELRSSVSVVPPDSEQVDGQIVAELEQPQVEVALHEAMATSMTQQEIEECADAMAVRVLAAEEELEASAPPSLFGPSGSRHEAEERLHALVERHLDLRLLELGYYLSINMLRAGRDDEEAVAAD